MANLFSFNWNGPVGFQFRLKWKWIGNGITDDGWHAVANGKPVAIWAISWLKKNRNGPFRSCLLGSYYVLIPDAFASLWLVNNLTSQRSRPITGPDFGHVTITTPLPPKWRHFYKIAGINSTSARYLPILKKIERRKYRMSHTPSVRRLYVLLSIWYSHMLLIYTSFVGCCAVECFTLFCIST